MKKKDKKLGKLDIYGDVEEQTPKEGLLKRIWSKTIFPDKIKQKKEREAFEKELRDEAKEAAKPVIKEKLIEKYKQEEIDRATGVKKENNWAEKLTKGFSMSSDGVENNKYAKALGASGPGIVNEDKIKSMISTTSSNVNPPTQVKTKKRRKVIKTSENMFKDVDDYNFEDRIKRML